MEYIKRDLEKIISGVTNEYPVVIVTGPRQSGKTTMLQKMAEGTNRSYISLDDLDNRSLAKSDPKLFFQIHKPPLIIDEIQYAPELFIYIKIMADRDRQAGDFWLSGSQSFSLMDLAGESLAGRACILHMTTLSQNELYGSGDNRPFTIDIDKLKEHISQRVPAEMPQLYERIFNGSMPAIASGQVTNRSLFYTSYLQTYIERDIRDISGTIEATAFQRFLTAVACRAGQMINYTDISNDMDGMRSHMVKEWLGLMEKSDIIFFLHPYSNNLLKRTVSKPKLYFYDTGLVAWLAKWMSPETLMSGAQSGAILENYVVAEIAKTYLNAGERPPLFYYRDNDAKEIDIIIESDGMLTPIEIKKAASPDKKIARTFKLLDKGSVPRGRGAVLCMNDTLSAIEDQCLIVPIWTI